MYLSPLTQVSTTLSQPLFPQRRPFCIADGLGYAGIANANKCKHVKHVLPQLLLTQTMKERRNKVIATPRSSKAGDGAKTSKTPRIPKPRLLEEKVDGLDIA